MAKIIEDLNAEELKVFDFLCKKLKIEALPDNTDVLERIIQENKHQIQTEYENTMKFWQILENLVSKLNKGGYQK